MSMKIQSGRQVISLRKPDGTSAGTISISQPSVKKKKRLQYNFKEISTQIMMAKTSGSAGRVAAKARRKTALLQRKRKNEEYDEQELEQAIIHARKLERIAKKRKKHLEEEERANETGSCLVETDGDGGFAIEDEEEEDGQGLSREEMEKLAEEYRQFMEENMARMEDSMEEMEDAMGLKELADEMLGGVQEEMDPEELERLKKKHRSDELRDIMEADMKYLKALFDKLAKEKQSASSSGKGSGSGVSLQLGGVEMPVQVSGETAAAEGGKVDVSV